MFGTMLAIGSGHSNLLSLLVTECSFNVAPLSLLGTFLVRKTEHWPA